MDLSLIITKENRQKLQKILIRTAIDVFLKINLKNSRQKEAWTARKTVVATGGSMVLPQAQKGMEH